MELRRMAPKANQSAQAFAKACRQALFIIVTAAVIGLVFNALSPQGLDLIRSDQAAAPVAAIGPDDSPQPIELNAALEELNKGNAIFIDARSEFDYEAGHIKTARNLPEKTLDIWMPDFFNQTPPESPLIIYCSDPRCHLAERLALKLYEFGYTNVHILTAGWTAWQAGGYPAESGLTLNGDQSLNQTSDCSSEECRDEQTSPAKVNQSSP